MKIGKILAKVGGSIISNIVPGAGIVIDAINAFLPDDKKLPENATGQQAGAAINSLHPGEQAQVLSKQLDVEIVEAQEYTKVITALADADKSGSSTRPAIAKMMAWIVSFSVIVFSSALTIAIFNEATETIKQLSDAWPLMLAVLATPTALLRAYFGMRTKEKKARYDIGNGQSKSGGLLGDIVGLFKK